MARAVAALLLSLLLSPLAVATAGAAGAATEVHQSSTLSQRRHQLERRQDGDDDWTPSPDKFGLRQRFRTEPRIETAEFEISRRPRDASTLAPGYFFFTLQTFIDGGRAWGPQIFDDNGTLVYYSHGEDAIAPQEPHACDYMGEHLTHICASEVVSVVVGRWETRKAIVRNDYTLQQEPVGAVGELSAPDGHEFSMVDDGRAYLQPVYQVRTVDLRPYGAGEQGKILDACFQEVSVETGEETMVWCYLDHFEIPKTYIYLSVEDNKVNITSHLAGEGTEEKPWDAFHINSLDKNFEGDYLVSIRHTNEVLQVAGRRNEHGFEAGAVMWKLGGKDGDFAMGEGVLFSRQHHVRYLSVSEAETRISLFDNAWEGDNDPTSTYSSGKIVRISHIDKQASLVQDFRNANVKQSMAGGNMQVQDNGNIVVGWGWQPAVTEYDARGDILFDATISSVPGVFSYRTRKYPWVGRPHWRPKLLAYSQTCSSRKSPLTAYVSWNGATEVASWRFYVSFSLETGPWVLAGTYDRQGFETEAVLTGQNILGRYPFVPYVSAQALDARGQVLGEALARTWVPPQDERGERCGEDACEIPYFDYPDAMNWADECSTDVYIVVPGMFALLVVFFAIELCSMFYSFTLLEAVNAALGRGRRQYNHLAGDEEARWRDANEMR